MLVQPVRNTVNLPVSVPGSLAVASVATMLTTGFTACFTVTLKVHCAVLPPASVAVQTTLETPSANTDPDGGTQEAVAEQLSCTTGAGYVTTIEHWLVGAVRVWGAGQVIVGGAISSTVTVVLQELDAP